MSEHNVSGNDNLSYNRLHPQGAVGEVGGERMGRWSDGLGPSSFHSVQFYVIFWTLSSAGTFQDGKVYWINEISTIIIFFNRYELRIGLIADFTVVL